MSSIAQCVESISPPVVDEDTKAKDILRWRDAIITCLAEEDARTDAAISEMYATRKSFSNADKEAMLRLNECRLALGEAAEVVRRLAADILDKSGILEKLVADLEAINNKLVHRTEQFKNVEEGLDVANTVLGAITRIAATIAGLRQTP